MNCENKNDKVKITKNYIERTSIDLLKPYLKRLCYTQ